MKKQAKTEVFMDSYLTSLGLWRKPVAKDGFCLFRAVSEQLFNTQTHYQHIYQVCRFYFSPLEEEEVNLEWSEIEVMDILSRLYKRDFLIYEVAGKPPLNATENGFDKVISLCRIDDGHLHCVYPRSFMQDSALCQSIIYEILYRGVFKLDHELEEAVSMIRDQNKNKRRAEHSYSYQSLDGDSSAIAVRLSQSRCYITPHYKDRHMRRATPPVPYRIAKALDPDIYRNVELDIWEEEKREIQLREKYLSKEIQFAPGDKCQVILDSNSPIYHGHIQELDTEGPVIVFIEELGEKREVSFDSLRPLPFKYNLRADCVYRHYRRKKDMPVATSVNGGQSIASVQAQSHPQDCVPGRCKNWQNTQMPGNIQQRTSIQFIPENKDQAYSSVPLQQKPQVYVSLQQNPQRPIPPTVNMPPQAHYQTLPQMPANMPPQQPVMPPPVQPPMSVMPQMTPVNPTYTTCIWVPYLETLTVSQVNVSCMPSQDPAGKDLPISDMNSLRFFFNLGVEYYQMVSQCCSMTVTDVSPTGTEIPQIGNPNGQLPPPPNQFSVPPPIIYRPNIENVPQFQAPTTVPTTPARPDADQSSMSPIDRNTLADTFQTKSDGNPSEFDKEKSSSPHDSGCESDCASGGRHSEPTNDDGKLKTDVVDNAPVEYDDNKPNEDTVPKLDLENFPEISDHTREYTSKPKRKYYMYGNHKLIKPIKDIPPRFQMMLAETSAAKARCEGQPIIIQSPICHNEDFPPEAYGNSFNPDAKCFIPGNMPQPDNVMNGDLVASDKECSCIGPHNPGDGNCSCSLLYTVHVYGSNTASSPACSSSCSKSNGAGCSGCLTNTSTHSPFYTGGYGNAPCLTQGPTYYTNQPYPMTTPVPYPHSGSQYLCNGGQIPMVGPMPPPPQALQAQAPPPPPPQPLAPPPTKVAPMPAPVPQQPA
ncbi:hypothetical protein ScPMuIL_009819 [Solemya velum]